MLFHLVETLDQARRLPQIKPVVIGVEEYQGNVLGYRIEPGAGLGVEGEKTAQAVNHVNPCPAGGDKSHDAGCKPDVLAALDVEAIHSA